MDAARWSLDGNDTNWVSVSIQRNPEPYCNMHAGILYRDAGRRLHWLHLGWHRSLYHEQYDGNAACASPVLDSADELFLAGFCGRIWRAKQNKEIPYSLKNDPAVTFNPLTGAVSLLTGTGLNCATFIVAVFRSASNDIIDDTGWPANRPGDKEQQQKYVDMLRNDDDDDRSTQGKRIAPEVGCPRIRPEEVAGACLADALPCGFSECETNGAFVRDRIDNAGAAENGA